MSWLLDIGDPQEIVHSDSPIYANFFPGMQTFEGNFIQSLWIKVDHPMTMVVSHVESSAGRGSIYVFFPAQGPHSVFGTNVPYSLAAVNVIHDGVCRQVFFTYFVETPEPDLGPEEVMVDPQNEEQQDDTPPCA